MKDLIDRDGSVERVMFWRKNITSKREHFIRLHGEFIQVVHPTDGATGGSLQTVGFHANASDVEIALELIHLAHDIKTINY